MDSCWCWTAGMNRVRTVVQKKPAVHFAPCKKFPLMLSCGCIAETEGSEAEIASHLKSCPYLPQNDVAAIPATQQH